MASETIEHHILTRLGFRPPRKLAPGDVPAALVSLGDLITTMPELQPNLIVPVGLLLAAASKKLPEFKKGVAA